MVNQVRQEAAKQLAELKASFEKALLDTQNKQVNDAQTAYSQVNEVFKRFDKIEIRTEDVERNAQFASKITNDRITSQEDRLHPLLKLSEDAAAGSRGRSIQDSSSSSSRSSWRESSMPKCRRVMR